MQFAFTPEQEMIRDTAFGYADEHGDPARLRAAIESPQGFDRSSWHVLTGELGFGGIAIAEAWGGVGLGIVELSSVEEALGRVLLPSPFLTSIGLSATAIAAGDSEDLKQALLPSLASGEKIAAFAHCGERGGAGPEAIAMRLRMDRLDGIASFVQFADVADYIVFAALDEAGATALAIVPSNAPGIEIERLTMMDLTRPMCRVRCTDVGVDPAMVLRDGGAALKRAMTVGAVLLAAEATGGAQAALEITAQYARERKQFGRVIGSFQAVKHRLADMMIACEEARSLAWSAAAAVDEGAEDLELAASAAKAACANAMTKVAGDMIQLHGGIGFTWEHSAHLYFKRARAIVSLLGPPAWHHERIMAALEQGLAA